MEKNREAAPQGMSSGLIILLVLLGTAVLLVLLVLAWPLIKTIAGLVVGALAIGGFLFVATGRRVL